MSAPVQALFAPFRLGSLELPTRVVMAPMTRSFSPGGVPNAKVVEYYRRRAAAGVGLIVTEGTTVGHKAANGYPNVPRFYGEDALAGWKQVVDAVHAEGGKIVPQLWHVGNVRRLGTEPDVSVPGYGPMEKVKDGEVVVHGMTQADIDEVIGAFAQAARDAKAIGMDGVEIHGAHGYLIDQFFWEGSNQRTDSYGGDLAARSRFAIELIQAVRAAVRPTSRSSCVSRSGSSRTTPLAWYRPRKNWAPSSSRWPRRVWTSSIARPAASGSLSSKAATSTWLAGRASSPANRPSPLAVSAWMASSCNSWSRPTRWPSRPASRTCSSA